MKIIEPKVELWRQEDAKAHVARCARVCYGKETGNLPIDTATRCVYTYSILEWRAILDLRYYGTTGKPHPNAYIIASMIRDELMELGYDFR